MKKRSINYMILAALLVVWIPAGAGAQTWPDTLEINFDFEGFGNLITMSPPVYSGDITSGDPEVAGGTWSVEIDDSEWPPTTDPDTRWNYIFNNYFNYNGVGWDGIFDGNNLPQKPTWEIVHSTNGTMNGTLVISFFFGDWDMDGVLDIEERTHGDYSGTLMVMKYGSGEFAKYCGDGSYNGCLDNSDPANYVDDFVYGNCLLNLVNCQIESQMKTWSAIKGIYR